ncbi:MAG: RNA-binding S4 domain-containing protein, partial [Propionibacteriaceae bacterium]|nr:RNA-binding S4 domain-containing protein [Propionibacteriaceae bacterium]
MDKVRVDSWLWSVRLFPSRTAASTACKAGHVRVNDTRAKPATTVGVGDRV